MSDEQAEKLRALKEREQWDQEDWENLALMLPPPLAMEKMKEAETPQEVLEQLELTIMLVKMEEKLMLTQNPMQN